MEGALDDIFCADSLSAFLSFYGKNFIESEYVDFKNGPQTINMIEKKPNECPVPESLHYSATASTAESSKTDDIYSSEKKTFWIQGDEHTPEKTRAASINKHPVKRGSNFHVESLSKKRLFGSETMGIKNKELAESKSSSSVLDSSIQHSFSGDQKDEMPPSFSLPKLYKYFFGCEPDIAHTSEDDCLTLRKVIRLKLGQFFSWCNQNAHPFHHIKPMY